MADDTVKNVGAFSDGADAKAYASDTNFGMLIPLTNTSGGSVATGDLLVLATNAANAFTTTTTANDQRPCFVVPLTISGDNATATKTIAAAEIGWVYRAGAKVPKLNVLEAVAVGEYLVTGTTAKQAAGSNTLVGATTSPPTGAFAIALTAATAAGSVEAYLLPPAAAGASYAVIADQKTAGTDGGTFTTGAWRTRDLNTEINDADGIVSIAANQFTPIAGTYLIIARAQAYVVAKHQTRLYNATATAVVLVGSNALATVAGDEQSESHIMGIFTANGTDAYEIQHQCQTTAATSGFGLSINGTFAVTYEKYCEVTLIKIA